MSFSKIKTDMKNFAGRVLLGNLLFNLDAERGNVYPQRKDEYYEWLQTDLLDIVDGFVRENDLLGTFFMKKLDASFETVYFDVFLKKFITEYAARLFDSLDDCAHFQKKITLEDNPLNRIGVQKYSSRFKTDLCVIWKRQQNFALRILNVLLQDLITLYLSLSGGLRLSGKRKKYKIMREALWGLKDKGGLYFHDDFFVDNKKIKNEDVVLFSKRFAPEVSRVRAYNDAKASPYAHFDIKKLSIGVQPFFARIISKYVFLFDIALLAELRSPNFSVFSSVFLYFVRYAVPYERVFSNYEIGAELGHSFYSPSHVAEAIVCRNYGTEYSLMHWSDTSLKIGHHLSAHLGADNYFVWGQIHVTGGEGDKTNIIPAGYVFKRFIKKVRFNRNEILKSMGINGKGKIISFFDEVFRVECRMTEEHYINFWQMILNFAKMDKLNTILIKPKIGELYKEMSPNLIEKFLRIKSELEQFENVHIIDDKKWSFIEAIGVADIVVTQGMCSPSGIAIICGIEGLYLSEVDYDHPFKNKFSGKIVFDDSKKLLEMVENIIAENESPIKSIPESLLREFDAFGDDCGIDRFRNVLVREQV